MLILLVKVYFEIAALNSTHNISAMENDEDMVKKMITEEEAIERDFDDVQIIWTLMASVGGVV